MEPRQSAQPSEPLLAQMAWVRGLARGLLGNTSDADDVAQEVWIAARDGPPRPGSNLRAWLAVVTRHLVQQRGRSEARRRLREAESARPQAWVESDILQRAETCQRIVAAVMTLAEPYRSTVFRRYLDGWDIARIASHELVSEVAIRKRLSRALAELRIRLDKDFDSKREAWSVALARFALAGTHEARTQAALGVAGAFLMQKWVAATLLGCCLALAVFVILPTWQPTTLPSRSSAHPRATSTDSNAIASSDPRSEESDASRNALAAAQAMPARVKIAGTVFDLPYPDTSQPLRPAGGQRVTASLRKGMDATTTRLAVLTDVAGRYEIELEEAAPRPYLLKVHVEGDEHYRPKSSSLMLEDGDLVPEQRLERPAHGDLYGIVCDGDGRALPGVRVQCSRQNAPPLETTSDKLGAFVFGNLYAGSGFYPGNPSLAVQKSGYRLVPSAPCSPLKTGGWLDARLTLTQAGGRLAVRVEDAEGKPVPGVEVGVDLSQAEPEARYEPWNILGPRGNAWTNTDTSGTALLEEVWIGRKLALFAAHGAKRWKAERSLNGRVELGNTDIGSPIIIRTEQPSELRIVLPKTIRVRGQVLTSSRAPVAFATIFPRGLGSSAARSVDTSPVRTDRAGYFELELAEPGEPLRLRLVAGDTPETFDAWSLDQMRAIQGICIGEATLEIGQPAPEESYIDVVVQPTLAISGKVFEPDGSPCKGRIAALPESAAKLLRSPRGGGVPIQEDGAFEVSGLVPGRYVLEVKPRRHYVFTDCLLPQSFESFDAGTSGAVLHLSEEKAVQITLEISSPSVEVDSMVVALGMVEPHQPLDPARYEIGRERSFNGLSGWDKGATLDFGGQTGAIGDLGTTGFLHLRGEVPIHRLRSLAEGWYTIGIDAKDRHGERLHPCGTGLVYLRPGEYRLHFRLHLQTRIEGHVEAEHDDLWLGLVDDQGKPVQVMRTSRHLDEVVPVGAKGRFVIEGAPVGRYRLRVGRDEESLRAGRFLHEEEIPINSEGGPLVRLRIH